MVTAQDLLNQALHELDLQWGTRQLDYGKLRRILTGECEHPPTFDPPKPTTTD